MAWYFILTILQRGSQLYCVSCTLWFCVLCSALCILELSNKMYSFLCVETCLSVVYANASALTLRVGRWPCVPTCCRASRPNGRSSRDMRARTFSACRLEQAESARFFFFFFYIWIHTYAHCSPGITPLHCTLFWAVCLSLFHPMPVLKVI